MGLVGIGAYHRGQHDPVRRDYVDQEGLSRLLEQAGVASDATAVLGPHMVRAHELLGYPSVENDDGSWTEYGSLVGVPVER
jgi:3-mercaptopyruvate sulfurtransferase SseA